MSKPGDKLAAALMTKAAIDPKRVAEAASKSAADRHRRAAELAQKRGSRR